MFEVAVPAALGADGMLLRSGAADLPAGVLRCAGCPTLVEAVHPHARIVAGRHVEVRGHFRVAPGHTHAITCPFDFPRAAARIARAAPGIIRPLPTGYAVKIPAPPARTFGPSGRAWRPGRGGTPTTFLAAEAVVTIGRVAALLRRFGGQHAAPGAFTAAWGHQAIDWPEFCFDPASCVELVERLRARRWRWPSAVLFAAERAGQSKAGTTWWAGQTTDAHTNLDGERVGVRLTVRSRAPGPVATLDLGADALAFGVWQLYWPESQSNRRHARVVEAVCWINQPWQLAPAP